MTEALPQEILDELVRLEERFREATRTKLSKYDTEALMVEANRRPEKWTGGYSIMNVTRKITHEEATKFLYDQRLIPLGHKNSMGS